MDLADNHNSGMSIPSSEIKKHKNDVFRLFRVIAPENRIELPRVMKSEMRDFLSAVSESGIDTKQLGYSTIDQETLFQEIEAYYGLDPRYPSPR